MSPLATTIATTIATLAHSTNHHHGPIPAERFQNDKAELYEEPTIAEMEAAIAEEEEGAAALENDSDDGSFEFEPMEDLADEVRATETGDGEAHDHNQNIVAARDDHGEHDEHDDHNDRNVAAGKSTKRKRTHASVRSNKPTKK